MSSFKQQAFDFIPGTAFLDLKFEVILSNELQS